MKVTISKFTLRVNLVMACFAATFLVTKACMLLALHRRFVGCDLKLECVFSRHSQLAFIFARQASNKESNMTKDDDVLQVALLSSMPWRTWI